MEQPDPIEIIATPQDQGTRLDRFLAGASEGELSRTRVKALIQDGQLTCNGETLTDPSASVKSAAIYQLTLPPPQDPTPQAEDIPLSIYFEDEHLIVLEKPFCNFQVLHCFRCFIQIVFIRFRKRISFA